MVRFLETFFLNHVCVPILMLNLISFLLVYFLSLFPNRLYHDGFFKCCLLSDDEYIRDIVVKLYRVSFRAPGADTATPQAILCHSIQLYRDYRVSSNFVIQFFA